MIGRAGTDKRITKVRMRRPGLLSVDVLESLKAIRKDGSVEISCSRLAKITDSPQQNFYHHVRDGKIQKTKRGWFDLDSVISWIAKGIASEAIRTQGDHGMGVEWMADDPLY